MAELSKSLKGIWLKSMEAISNTASNIASNTKYKVDEMNIVNRRREILSDFGAQAYELWQKGVKLPEPLDSLLAELSQLDEALNAIRTEKLAGVNTEEQTSEAAEEPKDAQEAAEDAAESVEEAVETMADAAEDAVEAAKDSVAGKIDNVMDNVSEKLSRLGSAINNKIEALSKAMKPKTEENPAEPEEENAAQETVVVESIGDEEHAAPVIQVSEEAEEAAEADDIAEDLPEEPAAPTIEYTAAEETKPEEEPQG